jgi:hypothetical protein
MRRVERYGKCHLRAVSDLHGFCIFIRLVHFSSASLYAVDLMTPNIYMFTLLFVDYGPDNADRLSD